MKTIPRTLGGIAFGGIAAFLGAAGAHAAAIERAAPSSRVLFEPGRYLEFGLSYTDPDQSGDDVTLPPQLSPTGAAFFIPDSTGDLFDSHLNFSAAWKNDIGERLSYAVIFDQPYGADTDYSGGFYDGTAADLNTYQISTIFAYDVTPAVKAYGGLRAQRMDADAAIPFIGPSGGLPGYTVETDTDWGYGWLAGAAFERPEIALRVALTYYSEIDHEFDTEEFGGIAIPGVQAGGDTRTDITTPQSVNLEFQTGVAERTLVFGSIRWVDWSEFAIAPPTYTAVAGRPLVDYPDDWTTYTLGVGRQITDTLSGALSVSYEPSVDEELTTLGPYDGRTTVTAALSYEVASATITGGLTYGRLGDTTNVLDTDFNDGSVLGLGLRVGYSF